MFKRFIRVSSFLLLGLFLIGLGSYFAMAFYVDYQLDKRSDTTVFNSCDKVWAARGIYQKGGEVRRNSVASVAKTFSLGGSGVEIDIYFMPEDEVFFVSHGNPENSSRHLTLKAMFDAVGVSSNGYFWLDYKNLGELTPAQTAQAIERLSSISAQGGLRGRLYIEGTDPIMLTDYRRAGFHTILDAQLPPDSWPVTHFVTTIYKAAYYFGGHSVLGMPYGTLEEAVYGPQTRERLGEIPVFLYHVPDNRSLLQELVSRDAVRALLVGRDISVARFDINACGRNQDAGTNRP